MDKIELLCPVGNFESLKAAVQNGANAVYLGVDTFNARTSATNFTLENLEDAINYAKLRNVKVHLALNTLIKNSELDQAFQIAKTAYEKGIDAIIVQDFGLANILIKEFPDLPIHASTQMTIHNLDGVKQLEKLGFKRAILSRELSLYEIEHICANTNMEIEVFIHGALCICYSGQCLFSSMIGGRSGNRGKCAQACRLPYELIDEQKKVLDKGHILSPKDLYSLDFLPDLVKAGVSSFKIEGRLKSPEYVAVVTKIYRKYLDLACSNSKYIIDEKDKSDLLQMFNRGGFSSGHLDGNPNRSLIFKDSPGNLGIYIGNVSNYNKNKKYVTLNLNTKLNLGDTVTFENEKTNYKVSELMINDKNVPLALLDNTVKIGRMVGNINPGDKVFKITDKLLSNMAKESYSSENIKNKLNCSITILPNKPISLSITEKSGTHFTIKSNVMPIPALTNPITKERIVKQLQKTTNTPFCFGNIEIILGDNLYVPSISTINELRRLALEKIESNLIASFKRKTKTTFSSGIVQKASKASSKKHICLLLNNLDLNKDYSQLVNIKAIYIPLKYFAHSLYKKILLELSNKSEIYIYMPNIIKDNYKNLFMDNISKALSTYNIKGFVISNISTFELLETYKNKYEFVGNYTLNNFNTFTSLNLKINTITLSPELNKEELKELSNSIDKNKELIVYGNLPLMTMRYCLLGKSTKCYPTCSSSCKSNNKFYLKDRLGLSFRIIPDNIQTVTTVYNSKTTSILYDDINVNSIRIDILDESIDEINNIIHTVQENKRFEGSEYTNGNLNKNV